MRIRFAALALLVVASSAAAQRASGPAAPTAPAFVKEFGTMWTFDAPPLEHWKRTYGFAATPEWLERVRLSAIRIPGCSASLVSANGLVMTNHHCARSCIAASSTADSNYIETGFSARTAGEEKSCRDMFADQLQQITDVTPRIRKAVTAATPAAQVEQRTAAIAALEKECQTASDVVCQVVTFYQGGMYSLYRYKRWTDIRLVMAPEGDMAFYGGDPDNFTFPRYDLDLTLLRIYDDGQPLRPQHYLRWSAAGAAEGEPVFVTGNPGSTGRMLTLAQMEYLRDVQYPATLAGYDRQLAVIRELVERDPSAARRYQNTVFGLENSKKATTGYRAGLLDSTIMARKAAFERDFRARVQRDPALRARFGTAWDEVARAQKELASFATALRWRSFGGGSNLLNWAGGIVRLQTQAALPDSMRLPQYRGQGLERVRALVTGPQVVDTAFERRILEATFCAWMQELPPNDPLFAAALAYGDGDPAKAAERLVRETSLKDPAARRALVEGGAAALAASKDPLIQLARRIDPENRVLAMRAARLEAVASANAERLGQAIFAAYGTALPPDATFTLRISDGVVQGYPMNGTIAPYKTTFYGLYERAESFDHKPPFKLPPRWAAGRPRLDLSTPFNFASTNDIIGGNSGSPVINRAGEVVGLIFDGNIEMLPNRFIFTDERSRAVSVHSRAITEALRKLYDGARIADELEGR